MIVQGIGLGGDHFKVRGNLLIPQPPPQPGQLIDIGRTDHRADRQKSLFGWITGRFQVFHGGLDDAPGALFAGDLVLKIRIKGVHFQNHPNGMVMEKSGQRFIHTASIGEELDLQSLVAQKSDDIFEMGVNARLTAENDDFAGAQPFALQDHIVNLFKGKFIPEIIRFGHVTIGAAEVATEAEFDLHGQQTVVLNSLHDGRHVLLKIRR